MSVHGSIDPYLVVVPDVLAQGVAGLRLQSPSLSTIGLSALTPEYDDDLSYNMRSEPLPDAPIYNPELQAVLGTVKEQLGEIERTMGRCSMSSDTGSNISTLFQQTRSLAHFEYPTTRTIGFVGDSGVGKNNA